MVERTTITINEMSNNVYAFNTVLTESKLVFCVDTSCRDKSGSFIDNRHSVGSVVGESLTVIDGPSNESVVDGLTDGTVFDGLTDGTVIDGLTDETEVDGLTEETAMDGLIDERVVLGSTKETKVE